MTTASQYKVATAIDLEILPYGVAIVREGIIVKTNSYLTNLLKRSEEDLIDTSFSALVFEEDQDELRNNKAEVNKKSEVRIIDNSGFTVWCEVKAVEDSNQDAGGTIYYISELTRQKINENILNILMKRMAQTGESQSFESMVTALTEVLGFHYAFIGMYNSDTDEITIRAMSIANKLQQPFGYAIIDTPCGDVIRNGSLAVSDDIQEEYPEDHYLVDWEVDAYVGVALKNGKNETIGHLAVMDTKPIENSPFITSLLSIFSYRLGVKMEHEIQEKELKRSEKRYKSLFNDSFEAKVIFDRAANKIIEGNDAAAKLFLIPKEKFNGLTFKEIKPKKSVNGMLSEEQISKNLKQIDSGNKVHTETLSKRSDGTIFPTDMTLSIFGGDKNLLIVSYRDISEKKKVQDSLEISEKRFRSLFEYSFDAIFLMNMETNTYDNCNARALELFQYDREQLLTMRPNDLVAPIQKDNMDPNERIRQNIESLTNNKRLKFEFCFIKADGNIFEAEVSLLPIINEQKTFCITIIKDISEKKRQEASLTRRKQFLRKVIDLNPNLIFAKDKTGKFTVANKATGDFLGVQPDDLIGQPWQNFYSNPNEINQIKQSDQNILMNKEGVNTSIENITCCNGIKHSLQTSKMPILNEHGEVEQVLHVSTDISPHVKMEKELRDNNLELKKVNTELDHFVYRASHDLRAPLASILGFTNLSKNENSITELKRYNEFIEKQIEKLDGFIRDIISYSRIARTDKENCPISFKKIVDDIFESLLFLNNASDIKKEFELKGDMPFYSDLQSITFILKNLLSNAIKYSRPQKTPSYIKVTITITEKNAEISVKDNGIGIEPEFIPSIFDMFYRATERSDGSGLGLFIVRQSVDKLEGQIFVDSQAGQGTEFIITLPNTAYDIEQTAG